MPVLVRKLPSPEYTAVIVWVPVEREDIPADVALPLDNATGEPKSVPSTLNWTVPVRVPEPGALAVTVAVKVIDWPNADGLAEELVVVVVLSLFIVCDNVDDVLPLKLVSPAYSVVML